MTNRARPVFPTFCGQPITGGIHPLLATCLARVEPGLLARAIRLQQASAGYHPRGGKHGIGLAIDLDYDTNPYIATRTGTTFGGERAGAHLMDVRKAALDACDRAMVWSAGPGAKAGLHTRKTGEKTGPVWDRFNEVSKALSHYLGLAFFSTKAKIHRAPVLSPWQASLDVLRQIPTSERQPEQDAKQAIQDALQLAPHWPLSLQDTYIQILRDYETVRIPMVFGVPMAQPPSTRNPARGFMTLPRSLAEDLCDIGGLRWGACDFGAAESGDVMHFDLDGVDATIIP